MQQAHEREHALRNYLAIILGYSEILLQEAAADDPRRGDYEEIQKAAQTALRLVGDGDAPA
jgi:signal transduction histidine kinase